MLLTGEIDHPGQLFRPSGPGVDVVPDVLIDPERADPGEPGPVGAIATSSGWMDRHTVRQLVPSCRASPEMLACSRRRWATAHQRARVVSSARGRATPSRRSVNTPTGHAGSGPDQVRLRHTTRTGRPNDGASIRTCSRRPWLRAMTPHRAQPIGPGGDSTTTRNRPSSAVAHPNDTQAG